MQDFTVLVFAGGEVTVIGIDLPAFRREVGALLGAEDAFDVFPMDTRPTRSRLRWRRAPEPWDAVVVM